jgi:FkbM family methyltransferase
MKIVRSIYGPLMVLREQDQTNRFARDGKYGQAIASRLLDLPKHAVFFDVGANAGIFSLIAARHLSDGEVIAFEPNRRVFADLLENIGVNKLSNITALNVALGPTTELVQLGFLPTHTGMGHIMQPGLDGATDLVRDRVLQVSVSDLAGAGALLNDRPGALKIDTEGYEPTLLRAFRDAGLLARFDLVIIEVSPSLYARYGATVAEAYDLMERCGFRPELGPRDDAHYDEFFRAQR